MSNDIHENRVRRMARRQGLRLSKSRRRDERAYDYGMYVLVDETNTIVFGAATGRYDCTLEECEEYLNTPDEVAETDQYQRMLRRSWKPAPKSEMDS